MKKTLLTVAASAVAVSCLAWAQPPQGAKETVVIKEEASKKAPKEHLDAPGAAPKPQVKRDPFVEGGTASAPPPPELKPKEVKPQEKKDGDTAVITPKIVEKPVAPPEVQQ